jgi:hypothetical protein
VPSVVVAWFLRVWVLVGLLVDSFLEWLLWAGGYGYQSDRAIY